MVSLLIIELVVTAERWQKISFKAQDVIYGKKKTQALETVEVAETVKAEEVAETLEATENTLHSFRT